jgi:deoxycytidine triphosphate deaminase
MLSDRDIAAELFRGAGGARLIGALPEYAGTKWADLAPDDPKWVAPNSPIQPSSVDLHVGYIYVPGSKPNDLGSETRPASSHAVGPGESVIVSTYERVTLPPSLGGIVFPPSRLSSQGLLVANIGHIDPGFSGHLRFTVINMGGKPIPLVRGTDAVGTLLLLPLKSPSATPWLQRLGDAGAKGEPTRSELDALSKDFGNMDARIAEVTERTVKEMKKSYNLEAFLWPIVLSIALGVLAIYFSTGQYLGTRVDTNLAATAGLKNELTEAKAESLRQQAAISVEVAKLQTELEEARRRLSQLENRNKR